MYLILAATLLGAPNLNCPPNAVCATSHNGMPAIATINITATVISNNQLSMDVEQLEFKEAYAVSLEGITTGVPDAKTIRHRYLVIDDSPSAEHPLQFGLAEGEITISDNPRNVFVMYVPDNMTMPKGKELLAMVEAVMLVKNPAGWLAANRAKKKIKTTARK